MVQECKGSMGTKSEYQSVSPQSNSQSVIFRVILKGYKSSFTVTLKVLALSKCYPSNLKLLNESQVLPCRCTGNFHLASSIANPHSIQSLSQ